MSLFRLGLSSGETLWTAGLRALINACYSVSKSFILNKLFTFKSLDFLFLTTTWQMSMEYSSLIKLCTPDYSFYSFIAEHASWGCCSPSLFPETGSLFELQITKDWSFKSMLLYLERVIMVVDFNIHNVSCSFAADFLNVTNV